MKAGVLATAVLVVPFCALGCSEPASDGSDEPPADFDFTNGPSDLPNVFRGDSILLFAWADTETDLVITINAPAGGVRNLRACGGLQRPERQPVQTVGEFQGVLRQLRVLRDANIHLYRPVPAGFTNFLDLCLATPFAQGRGDLTSTDNDRLDDGPGANAFGSRAAGVVEVGGVSARVRAERQALNLPDGTRVVLLSEVVLHSN